MKNQKMKNQKPYLTPNLHNWLLNGKKVPSAMGIFSVVTGCEISKNMNIPVPDSINDLIECFRLIDSAPEIAEMLPRMKEVSKEWSGLISHWTEIRNMLDKEISDPGNEGEASKTYSFMMRVINTGKSPEKENKILNKRKIK